MDIQAENVKEPREVVFTAIHKERRISLQKEPDGEYSLTTRMMSFEETENVSVVEAALLEMTFKCRCKFQFQENKFAAKELQEAYMEQSPAPKIFASIKDTQGNSLAAYYVTLGGCNFYKDSFDLSENIAPANILSELQEASADKAVIVKSEEPVVKALQDYVYDNIENAEEQWTDCCGNFVDKEFYEKHTKAYQYATSVLESFQKPKEKTVDFEH